MGHAVGYSHVRYALPHLLWRGVSSPSSAARIPEGPVRPLPTQDQCRLRARGSTSVRTENSPSYISPTPRTTRKSIPGLMFFHIPLPEFHQTWEHRENHDVLGEKNEDVAAAIFNSGLFGEVKDRGDVVGIFAGHDHVNDFVGDYFGVRLGYSANAGFGTYGLDGENPDRLRGARVFRVPEDDPGSFDTFMVYAGEYGIQ